MKKLILFLLLLIVSSNILYSQEIQIAFDKECKLMEIDRDIARDISIFQEYPGFQNAKLYQTSEDKYVIEIFYKADGLLQKVRNELTQVELDSLRNDILSRINASCPTVLLDQEGRTELLIGSTTLSLAIYGSALPAIMDTDDPAVNVLSYTLVGASGFFIPYMLTEDAPVSEGAAHLANFGGLMGLYHGMSFNFILGESREKVYWADPNDCPDCFYYDTDFSFYEKRNISLMTLTSIAEFIAGYHIAQSYDLSLGEAHLISSLGVYGTLMGITANATFNEKVEREDFGLSGILGSAAGFYTASLLSNNQNYTPGDVSIMMTSTYLGAYIPFALYTFTEPDFDDSYQALLGTMMLGSAVAMYVGNDLVNGYDFKDSHGTYTEWGTFLGGLLGFGLGFAIDTESPKPAMLGSVIGSTVTFTALYNKFKKSAQEYAFLDNIDIQVNPVGLASAVNNVEFKYSNPAKPLNVPIINLQYTLD